MSFHSIHSKLSRTGMLLALALLVMAVIGTGKPAWAGSLPVSGTCSMLVTKSFPPAGGYAPHFLNMLVSISFGDSPSAFYNAVTFNWKGQEEEEGGVISQQNGNLSSVAITPNASLSGFYTLTALLPDGKTQVGANLVPVNNSNTILVQMYAPSALSGVCQLQ